MKIKHASPLHIETYTTGFRVCQGLLAKAGFIPYYNTEVQRLQRWCEAQLCNQLSAEQVCCILRQAHVFEAAQLEKACLSYIKDNSAQVLKLQAYSDLISKWPEVALKIHLFTAGVPEAEAAAIVQARKVRRLNDGVERTS